MSHKDRKKKGRQSKIGPFDESDSRDNKALEMAGLASANNISASAKFRDVSKEVMDKAHPLQLITNVKHAASKWSNYVAKRRMRKQNTAAHSDDTEKPKTGGIGLDDIHEDFVVHGSARLTKVGKELNMSMASNRALIQYFAKLGQSTEEETLNLDFVDTLLNSGADINCCDKYGQTILHEVARAWHTDVARFLLEHGANVNTPDKFGRTPLHVAAAVDYPQMVTLLIDRGADKEALTKDENQTPVHFAARNDANMSLRALVKAGCHYKEVKDFKGRTPIHLAAELDRSETARLLLDLNAPVGVSDKKGQKAITWMITKMAPVANEALSQFRTTDRPNRKQYYYLNLLVQDREQDPNAHTQTPLQVAVTYKQYDLLMQTVFRKLIDTQWQKFGRRGAWINLLINFVYIVLWSAIGILVEYDERHMYKLPGQWWRIVLLLTAIGFTAWQIFEEVREFFRSKKAHKKWVEWRTKEIDEDLQFCHPRWPEERAFLLSEKEALDKQSPKYFSDAWNLFDWACYFFLLLSIATHFGDIGFHTETLARWHIRIMCVTIILLWLRLMKNARAFSLLGPFIVMLGHMIKDLLRFLFLYLEFYIPFACAFWMIFGGDKRSEASGDVVVVDGFGNPSALLFTLFRLTLVDEYDYPNMKLVDSFMADILVGTWLALSAILCLNLFIALLSDTFQRVYDNAQANSVMQRAITIINIWEGMSKKRRMKFLDHIQFNCAPLTDYYDDDLTQSGEEDLKKVTLQIKDQLNDIQEAWKFKFGSFESAGGDDSGVTTNYGASVVTVEKFESEIHSLQKGIREMQERQDDLSTRFHKDLKNIRILLLQLLKQEGGSGAFDISMLEHKDSHREEETHVGDVEETRPRRMRKRKSRSPYERKELLVPLEDKDALQPSGRAGEPHAEISVVKFPGQPDDEGEEEV